MTRSQFFKHRHIKAIFMIWIKEWLFNTAVAVVLTVLIVLMWQVFNSPAPFSPSLDDVAALRVPPQAMRNLHMLSQWHDASFEAVFALYAVNNSFFPKNESPVIELETLNAKYIAGFNRLHRQYTARDTRPYLELIQRMIRELEYFPVPVEYSYMFSDTWDQHRGTNILDQENIRGRIPVMSMTAGYVHQSGWHPVLGYHIAVITENRSRILYAHLDNLEEKIVLEQRITAGQVLGTMGSSGAALPVHLHIRISPSVSFAEDFWINPYPFLRHLQEVTARIF